MIPSTSISVLIVCLSYSSFHTSKTSRVRPFFLSQLPIFFSYSFPSTPLSPPPQCPRFLCALSRSTGLTPPFQFGFPAALLSGEVIGTSAIGVIEGARVCVLMFKVLLKHVAKGASWKKGVKHIEEHFRASGKKSESGWRRGASWSHEGSKKGGRGPNLRSHLLSDVWGILGTSLRVWLIFRKYKWCYCIHCTVQTRVLALLHMSIQVWVWTRFIKPLIVNIRQLNTSCTCVLDYVALYILASLHSFDITVDILSVKMYYYYYYYY